MSGNLRSRGRYRPLAEIVMRIARHDGKSGSGILRRIVPARSFMPPPNKAKNSAMCLVETASWSANNNSAGIGSLAISPRES